MKKRTLLIVVAGLSLGLFLGAGSGCTAIVRSPALVVEPAPVVVAAPPARVYYGGRWLYYRSDGYYYYHGGHWMVASAVPHHVVSYHRPVHVSRVHHRHYTRPTHVRRYHRKLEKSDLDGKMPGVT